MRIKLLKCLSICGLLVTQTSFAATTSILEDFSSGSINATKFPYGEGGVTLDTTAQNIIMKSRGFGYSRAGRISPLLLNNGNSTYLQADLLVESASVGNNNSQSASASVIGAYYNTETATATASDNLGDVYDSISLMLKGTRKISINPNVTNIFGANRKCRQPAYKIIFKEGVEL